MTQRTGLDLTTGTAAKPSFAGRTGISTISARLVGSRWSGVGPLWPLPPLGAHPDRMAVASLNPIGADMPRRRDPEGRTADARRLEALVEEATVDCYDETEQALGLFTMIEDRLELPFQARVLGVEVTVVAVEQGDDGTPVAVCQRGRETQRICLLDLPLPSPPPKGAEWIAAYRHWARQG
jgi:Calcium binding